VKNHVYKENLKFYLYTANALFDGNDVVTRIHISKLKYALNWYRNERWCHYAKTNNDFSKQKFLL